MANVEHVEVTQDGVHAKVAVQAIRIRPHKGESTRYGLLIVAAQYGDGGELEEPMYSIGETSKDARRATSHEWGSGGVYYGQTYWHTGPTLWGEMRHAGRLYAEHMHAVRSVEPYQPKES